MNRQLIKTILGGALLGAALFYIPFFILKVLVIFLLFGMIFRLFGRHRGYRGPYGWAYADKIRNMSDDEYTSFKARMSHGRCRHPHHQATHSNSEEA